MRDPLTIVAREAGLAWPVAAVLCVVVVMAPSIISGMASRRVWRALDTRARSMPRASDHDEPRWWWVEENRGGGGGGGRCRIEDMQRGVPNNAPFYDEEDDDDAVRDDNDDSVELGSGGDADDGDGDRQGGGQGGKKAAVYWDMFGPPMDTVIRMRKKKGAGRVGLVEGYPPHSPQRWV